MRDLYISAVHIFKVVNSGMRYLDVPDIVTFKERIKKQNRRYVHLL